MADYPKLTVLFEKLRGKTFELNKEQMSSGRRDGNDSDRQRRPLAAQRR